VLRADTDGLVTVANAGHLGPYILAAEVPVDGSLPLGLSADSIYAESTFSLAEGSQLTLVTDGVVEARAKSGELLGFERTAALTIYSAESIARAAQEFGQEDDITVVTLTRLAPGEICQPNESEPFALPRVAAPKRRIRFADESSWGVVRCGDQRRQPANLRLLSASQGRNLFHQSPH
jgi:hypothetical protein